MAWKRFAGHKAALVCSGVLGFLVLAVVLSPLTSRYGVNEAVKAPPNSYLAPSKMAWLGTDDIGRDLYSRLIYGTRVSLLIGLFSAFGNGDFPLLMPLMVIIVASVLLFNLIADISYAILDPRIRLD